MHQVKSKSVRMNLEKSEGGQGQYHKVIKEMEENFLLSH